MNACNAAPFRPDRSAMANAERTRLAADPAAWKRWGPYVSERAWGTVREDYSATGEAWEAFSHDEARSRAYRWSEDGLAAVCDDRQTLCLGFAFWNGRDPILKERIFGLTGNEGNHGEDAKEYWWYLDSTPTHSFMRWRWLYPQAEFPYADLVAENRRRGRLDPEYELLDTGVLDGDRYFDVEATYAKAALHYRLTIPAGATAEIRLRLAPEGGDLEAGFTRTLTERRTEADEFYAALTPDGASDDEAQVLRQALAGMLWSKQFFHYDV